MQIPKYVQELMERSSYEYVSCRRDPNYAAGYTIRIEKRTVQTQVKTFKAEVEQLCKWANRVARTETAHILSMPAITRYNRQFAVVTIFDPVMKHIEQYIPQRPWRHPYDK